MFPATTERVLASSPESVNEAIRRSTETNIARAAAGGPAAIDARLRELDREWDIERTLEANAATLAATGGVLALAADRRWAIVPAIVGGFLLQHALQGWCPPVPVFRRLGVRTASEINRERMALKALRGDFRGVPRATADAVSRLSEPAVEAAAG